jgi:hypothetical protein
MSAGVILEAAVGVIKGWRFSLISNIKAWSASLAGFAIRPAVERCFSAVHQDGCWMTCNAH